MKRRTPDTTPTISETLRSINRLKRSTTIMLGAFALATSPAVVLATDIHITKETLRQTEPVIHHVAPAVDPSVDRSATIFIDGFGSENGSWTASKIISAIRHIDQGEIWALEFDKDGIDAQTIASTIASSVEASRANGVPIDSISLYGYSVGGDISADVAPILANDYDITLTNIIFDHTPIDGSAVRQSQRETGDAFLSVIDAAHTIGVEIEYSSLARSAIEAIYKDDISHIGAPTPLLRDQFVAGITADIPASLDQLRKTSDNLPMLIYITSQDPKTDYMVDVAYSADTLTEYAQDASFPLVVVPVDGAIHSRLDLTVDQYETALAHAAPDIAEARLIAQAEESLAHEHYTADGSSAK